MNIVFLGSGDFAKIVLENFLRNKGIDTVTIITQKAKPVGRKNVITPTPVGKFALTEKLLMYEVANSDDILALNLKADFFVVVDFGIILSEAVLNIPEIDCLNVHASLLPKFRGASPIQSVLLNNEEYTGVSVMSVVKELDAGPVLKIEKIKINFDDTYLDLMPKLALLGAKLLWKCLIDYRQLQLVEQEHGLATFCGKIKSSDAGFMPMSGSVYTVYGMYKAFYQWPRIYFTWNNKKIILVKVELVLHVDNFVEKNEPFIMTKSEMFIGFKDGYLQVLEIQPEGKKNLDVKNFLSGYRHLLTS